MNLKNIFITTISLLVLFSVEAKEYSTPPELLIDKGACPFECCTYQNWLVASSTKIYEKPNLGSKVITTIVPTENVFAITGEVHVKPVKFLVKKDKNEYKIGDVLWVYSYIGEGYFKVWFKGNLYEDDLGFSPGGGNDGSKCDLAKPHCFGFFERKYKDTWWVYLKTKNNMKGWAIEKGQFAGMSSCD